MRLTLFEDLAVYRRFVDEGRWSGRGLVRRIPQIDAMIAGDPTQASEGAARLSEPARPGRDLAEVVLGPATKRASE